MYERDIFIADLRLQIKNLKDKVASYESGEQYQKLKDYYKNCLDIKERENQKLKKELETAHSDARKSLKIWYEVYDDVIAEKEAAIADMTKELEKMRQRMYKAEQQRDEAKEALSRERKEKYAALTEVEDLKGQIQQLTARVNKDYTNSSKPSSAAPNHKKICNNREATNRKPGGQQGHVHHERKRLEPTKTIEIFPPDDYKDIDRYRPTGKFIHKELIKMQVNTDVIDYVTPEYICIATGKKVHADFPPGVHDEVNYDSSVKAMAYLLNNGCYVSIDKTRQFLSDISGGKIELSNGMICGLSKEFSKKTENERNEIFLSLSAAPVLNADFTFGRVNGKQSSVIICTAEGKVLYIGKEKKGLEGIKDSPVEHYQGILVSDHEASFRECGTSHQECLVHVERYLRSNIENDPKRKWSSEMLDWIKNAIHYRNEVAEVGGELDETRVKQMETEYERIIELARQEYEYDPPGRYYREGYNLYKRMMEDKQDYLLFLHDLKVPPTNNVSETAARKYKRKSTQVMCFRSMDGHMYFCDGLTIMESLKNSGENLYEGIAERFSQ